MIINRRTGDTDCLILLHYIDKFGQTLGIDLGIVVQDQHVLGTVSQSMIKPQIIPSGIAQVRLALDDLDLGIPFLDIFPCSISRAIIYKSYPVVGVIEPHYRIKAFRRHLLLIPRQNDYVC